MAATTRDEAERYALDDGVAVGFSRARLHPARDRRLDRTLRAWVFEEPRTSADRQRLRQLARDASRLTDGAYLRVVDVLDEDVRLVVLIENRPPPSQRAPHGGETELVERVRELASALRDAARLGLEPRRLPTRALLDGPLRLDPIDAFLEGATRSSLHSVLAGPLAEASTALRLAGSRPLAALARAWAQSPAHANVEGMSALLVQLEQAAGGAAHADLAWLQAGDEADAVFSSTDPTLRFELPPAAVASATRDGDDEARVEYAPPPSAARGPRSRVDSHRVLLGAIALGASVLVLGGLSAMALSARTAAPSSSTTPVASQPGPSQPIPGQVLVVVRAQEESFVRATVDGTVLFDGTMRSGETKSWQGRQRIQIYTNKGRSMNIAINGEDLGPYSPAMGHPDWNQIDFGFGPDWRP